MNIILASNNNGKVKEFKSWMSEYSVKPFGEVMPKFEIVEDGKSFKENALIKARAVYDRLEDKNSIVMADDSGICVDMLGGEPGIYSARYAGVDATSLQNLDKLVHKLKEMGVKMTLAHYTAAIAIVTPLGEFCVHGWMYGDIIDEKRGTSGFGYDPIFIPTGYDKTLGELGEKVKMEISHRSNALELAKIILKSLKR